MKMFFVGIVFCFLFFLSGSSNVRAEEQKEARFIFGDYALSVKYASIRDNYKETIHYVDCTDLTIHYNTATLGTVESCSLKEIETGKDETTLVLIAQFKSGTNVTFCEWPISKFVDPNAKKNKTKENVRLYLADPPRKIILVAHGKPK